MVARATLGSRGWRAHDPGRVPRGRQSIGRDPIAKDRIVYLLRVFPELTETFVVREIAALRSAGVPVTVIAIRPGTGTLDPEAAPPLDLHYLIEPEDEDGPAAESPLGVHSPTDVDSWSESTREPVSDARDPIGTESGIQPAPRPPARTRDTTERTSAAEVAADAPGPPADGERSAPRGAPTVSVPRRAWALGRALFADLLALRLSPRRSARALRLALYARRAAPLVPPDAHRLHAHFANDAGALARYVSILTGLPYRLTVHAYDLFKDPFLLDANLAAAQRVYTVSQANVQALRARAPARGARMPEPERLHCGLDLSEFAFRDPPPLRRPLRIVSIARLVPKKGTLGLLDAFERLLARGADLTLAIVGDGPEAASIRARAARSPLAGRIDLLGAVPPDRTRDLLAGADLLVLASRIAPDGDRDGLPVVLVEAMALGVPVVATRVAGIPELVDDATGRLAPPDDPERLAQAIEAALTESDDERIARARRARARVERDFDVRAQVERLASRSSVESE